MNRIDGQPKNGQIRSTAATKKGSNYLFVIKRSGSLTTKHMDASNVCRINLWISLVFCMDFINLIPFLCLISHVLPFVWKVLPFVSFTNNRKKLPYFFPAVWNRDRFCFTHRIHNFIEALWFKWFEKKFTTNRTEMRRCQIRYTAKWSHRHNEERTAKLREKTIFFGCCGDAFFVTINK